MPYSKLPAQLLLLLVCVVLLHFAGSGPAFCDEPDAQFKQYDDYRRHIAGGPRVSAWFGERVALVIDGEIKPEQRDAATMSKIVRNLDAIFDTYEEVTGRKPKLTAPLEGRIRVEVSSKVGGGLAHHGRLGVAIGDGFFEDLYKRVKRGEDTYDQVLFYEIARNYWMDDMNSGIDYHTSAGEDNWGWWTVGFNNAMSIFLPEQIDTIEDMYYFGADSEQFSESMEQNLSIYIEGKDKYDWNNSWAVPLVPWAERTSVNDLMTGLLIRLHRDHGGNEFIQRLYRKSPS